MPGLVLYAQVDGGFSCWDPARNYWKGDDPDREPAYRFAPDEIWNGLPLDAPDKLCNGLITDWGYWQLENGEPFGQLSRVLDALSPSVDEPLVPLRHVLSDIDRFWVHWSHWRDSLKEADA
jgi:hypothetical protein